MTDIAGRVALVTGGGSGIGRSVAKALAKEGASVVVADILFDRAKSVAEDIRTIGGTAIALACDVCERGVRQTRRLADLSGSYRTARLLTLHAKGWCRRLTGSSPSSRPLACTRTSDRRLTPRTLRHPLRS
jgi:NAD(P)-dependent dehydrogenase (short-subunit alcohol dehydrogenase family)